MRLVLLLALSCLLGAEEHYRCIPVASLIIEDSAWPKTDQSQQYHSRSWRVNRAYFPRVVLDGADEAYYGDRENRDWRWGGASIDLATIRAGGVVAYQGGADVTKGVLYVPNSEMTEMVAVSFTLPTAQTDGADRRQGRLRSDQDQSLSAPA